MGPRRAGGKAAAKAKAKAAGKRRDKHEQPASVGKKPRHARRGAAEATPAADVVHVMPHAEDVVDDQAKPAGPPPAVVDETSSKRDDLGSLPLPATSPTPLWCFQGTAPTTTSAPGLSMAPPISKAMSRFLECKRKVLGHPLFATLPNMDPASTKKAAFTMQA